jgi:hypothetical protein
MDVKIDRDFVENQFNDDMINAIIARLYYLTRKKMMVPCKIDDNGITMIM